MPLRCEVASDRWGAVPVEGRPLLPPHNERGPAERVTERGPQVRPSARDFSQALLRPGGFDIDQSQSAETDLPRFRGEVGVWDPGYLV